VIVLGLMSGTSVDGIDAAVVEIDEQGDELRLRVLGYQETPHDQALRARVLRLIQPASSRIDEACRLNVELGEAFARAARDALDALGVGADLVCSHGQTVWHEVRPDGSVAATLQIGEPSVIAERLGVTVVADFRPRDVAAGGQGAPLASYPDALLFADREKARAIHNLGGIGNVTWLPPGGALADFLAFDTGPGNALIDLAVGRLTGQRFDEDGRLAAAGRADEAELARLLAHPYFAMPPPKSTGRELFSAAFADDAIDRLLAAGRSSADVVATLTRLTARTVADQYRRFLPRWPDEVVLGGGGARNPTLRAWLAEELGGVRLLDHDEFGLPSSGREAIYFAVMGYQALHGRPNTVPACTGARHPVVMGKIVPGANYAALTRGIRPEVQLRRMRVAAARSASG
jgi:anhydro-N-acetylmuramic acid kinase